MQVIRRLRERGEPIRLFGESDYDAFQRLRKIEILAPEVNKVGFSVNRVLDKMCTRDSHCTLYSENLHVAINVLE